jgi:hypothetical protein
MQASTYQSLLVLVSISRLLGLLTLWTLMSWHFWFQLALSWVFFCTKIFCLIFSYYSVKFLTKSCWSLLLQACFSPLSDASSFVILYIVTSVYFSGVMVWNYWDCSYSTYNIFNFNFFYWIPSLIKYQVRLMLVLAPAACILSGIALSQAFDVLTRSIKLQLPSLLVDSPVDVPIYSLIVIWFDIAFF